MKKSTKRTLLASVMALLLCVSMLIGSTYAWFTDSVESGNNVIKAGNLDVEFTYWNDAANSGAGAYVDVQGATDIFDPNALWEPGHAEVVYLKVANAGTLALKYRMALTVLGNTLGKTKDGETIDLTKYINFAIVEDVDANAYGTGDAGRDAAIAAASAVSQGVHTFSEVVDSDADTHGWLKKENTILAGGAEQTFAVVVWMPKTVTNEANHDGVNVPYINLGLSAFATQVNSEDDSFGPDFDLPAPFPTYGKGVAVVDRSASKQYGEIRGNDGSKVATFRAPTTAIDSAAEELIINVEEAATNTNITVAAGSEVKTFEITATGIADGNTELIEVQLRIPASLDPNSVELYHYETLIATGAAHSSGQYYVNGVSYKAYDPTTGYITFKTASFSPYTVVYDAESEYEAPSADGLEAPKATVTYRGVNGGETQPIEWNDDLGVYPTEGLDATLESTFLFACPENLAADVRAAYEYWYCDFFVSLDRDLGKDEIFLGGNYGDFGWVGFHNGNIELPANEELPLLCSVTKNPWTYSMIESLVREFICGVGDVDDALEGATFTVKLRLINPEKVDKSVAEWWKLMDEKAYVDVNVVEYTFASEDAPEVLVIDGKVIDTAVAVAE